MKKLMMFAFVIISFCFASFGEIKSFVMFDHKLDCYYRGFYDNEDVGKYYDESYVYELNDKPAIYHNNFTFRFSFFSEGDFEYFFNEPMNDENVTDTAKDRLKVESTLLKKYGYVRVDFYKDDDDIWTVTEFFRVDEDRIMARYWHVWVTEDSNKKKKK